MPLPWDTMYLFISLSLGIRNASIYFGLILLNDMSKTGHFMKETVLGDIKHVSWLFLNFFSGLLNLPVLVAL